MPVRTDISISAEFEGIDLGDARLNARAPTIAENVAREPGLSLPKIFADESALEGTYRFLGNPRVNLDELLRPHVERTAERVGQSALPVLVLHDTTEMKFGGEYQREGLGTLPNGGQGFFAHVSLAASYDAETDCRDPLGVLAVQTIFRDAQKRKGKAEELESIRWPRGIELAEAAVAGRSVIHVADRESDAYEVLSVLHTRGLRFVVRNCHNRTTVFGEATKPLWDLVAEQPLVETTLKASIGPRRAGELGGKSKTGGAALKPSASNGRTLSARSSHPARTEREAVLRVSAGTHVIRRPEINKRYKNCPREISLNVVRVFEPEPPEGVEAVEWLLFTAEPISTPDEVKRIIDWYRARWLIEEFFKALKTGAAFENLQLEKRRSLLNALAVYLPIAWRLLRLRTLARSTPSRPASEVLTPLQLLALRALYKKKLTNKPTVEEALLAIAAVGGHLKRNGPPGWIVLSRGFHDVLVAEATLQGAADL